MLCTQHPDGLRGSLLEEVAGVGPVGRKRQLGRLWRPRAGPNSWESGAAKGHECLEAPMEGGGGVRGPPFMEEICASLAPIHRPADPKCAHRGDRDRMDPCLSPGRGPAWLAVSSCDSPVAGSSRDALRELRFYCIYLVAKLQHAKRCPSPWGK